MKKISQTASDYLTITVATVILCVGVHFFRFPNHFTTGGVTGLSVMLTKLFPSISAATFNNLLNFLLLGVGMLFLGKGFGKKTAYYTVLSSLIFWGLEAAIPMKAPLTDQPFMELIIAVLLPAFGSALLFNVGASSGGTDVIALLLKKYAHVYNTGTAVMLTDVIIATGAFFVFDVRTGVFSMFGLLIRGILMNNALNLLNTRKYFHIVSSDPAPVLDYIMHTLKRSATVFHGEGAFTGDDRTLIITVVSQRQAVDLRRFVKQHSSRDFCLITTTSDIIGKGFRSND